MGESWASSVIGGLAAAYKDVYAVISIQMGGLFEIVHTLKQVPRVKG